MPRLIYNVAISLDGFIAPPDESTSWIVEDSSIDFKALYARHSAFVMGRKTFEAVTSFVPEGQAGGGLQGTLLEGRAKEDVVVVSRSMKAEEHPDITILGGEYIQHIKSMKQRGGTNGSRAGPIWLMGGGWLARECLRESLLDSVETANMPVVLGDGFKLFGENGGLGRPSVQLKLRSVKVLDGSGIVMVEYDLGSGHSEE